MKKFISTCLFSMLAVSCASNNTQDLQQFVAHEKAQPAGFIKPLPIQRELTQFEYDGSQLKDPFAIVIEKPLLADEHYGNSPTRHATQALEQYPLDSLRMVGTLQQDGEVIGLVKSTDGVIHQVKIGHYLGQNYGMITNITPTRIHLNEKVQSQGYWSDQLAEMALNSK
ncbi:MAG: pilus assembly protein PilP [Methylococcales bacterium]|jgi:type IV pilus assembly protein PilP|nr:pilus assembly protein PilP [Methylococcales bacterium]MBT7444947.1 pilus assembly protein PilP [Methylococcales bacterium]